MYKIVSSGVQRLSDGAFIPMSMENRDYREYAAWLAEGNSPLPRVTHEERKEERLREMTNARNADLASLIVAWGGDQWDANEETSNRIANALSMIREAEAQGIPAPGEIAWRTADNQTRVLSLPALTGMGAAVFMAQQAVWTKNAQLKDAILAATTLEDVDAVEW
jgi:hypothetical protein